MRSPQEGKGGIALLASRRGVQNRQVQLQVAPGPQGTGHWGSAGPGQEASPGSGLRPGAEIARDKVVVKQILPPCGARA